MLNLTLGQLKLYSAASQRRLAADRRLQLYIARASIVGGDVYADAVRLLNGDA